jgi:uncharacterized membrane protein
MAKSQGPMELLMLTFDHPGKADEALKELRALKKEKVIGIEAAAVVTKDANGEASFKEPGDMTGKRGAILGAIGGALVGLIGGPAGMLAGAAIGATGVGIGAALRDSGFSNERLKEIQTELPPNSSALLALIEHQWVGDLINEISSAAIASQARQFRVTLGGNLTRIADELAREEAAGEMPPPTEGEARGQAPAAP